jgi:heme exporter protein A
VAPALEVRGLEKWYGVHPAVRGVDFSLYAGVFLTHLGPNGGGKSPLLRLLAGALRPSGGEIRLGGQTVERDDPGWRRAVGVLSHRSYLYPALTAEENLRLYARLYRLPDARSRVAEALADVGLAERGEERVRAFSRGMVQRLALARTLLHEPEIVLLDEPYTGLDPHAARMLRGVLERLKDGRRTVVLVTHNLSQGLELADRVAVQVAGRWVSDEPREAIDAGGFEALYAARVAGAG